MINRREILSYLTLSVSAIAFSSGCQGSDNSQSVPISPTAAERSKDFTQGISVEELRTRFDHLYDEVVAADIGYPQSYVAQKDGKETKIIDIPYLTDGKPNSLRLAKSFLNGQETGKFILVNNYNGYLNQEAVNIPANGNPAWERHPNHNFLELTGGEMQEIISKTEEAVAIAGDYPKFAEILPVEGITEDEFSRKFDELLKEAGNQNIGEPTDFRQPTEGRSFYYTDQETGILVNIMIRRGYRHTERAGFSLEDSTARSVDISFLGTNIADRNISSWENNPPQDFLRGKVINPEVPSFEPVTLSSQERAWVIEFLATAIGNALDYDPFPPVTLNNPMPIPTPYPDRLHQT